MLFLASLREAVHSCVFIQCSLGQHIWIQPSYSPVDTRWTAGEFFCQKTWLQFSQYGDDRFFLFAQMMLRKFNFFVHGREKTFQEAALRLAANSVNGIVYLPELVATPSHPFAVLYTGISSAPSLNCYWLTGRVCFIFYFLILFSFFFFSSPNLLQLI